MDMGADDYLTKPFEEEELISAIESRSGKNLYSTGSAKMIIAKMITEVLKNFDELKKHLRSYELKSFDISEIVL